MGFTTKLGMPIILKKEDEINCLNFSIAAEDFGFPYQVEMVGFPVTN